jgi:ribosomal protein L12E/L44/L45/RPP1/RPP2
LENSVISHIVRLSLAALISVAIGISPISVMAADPAPAAAPTEKATEQKAKKAAKKEKKSEKKSKKKSKKKAKPATDTPA